MSIDIEIHKVRSCTGETVAVEAEAIILFSPKEGFNADELAALEKDLGKIVTERLNAALKKGGAA